MMDETDRLIMKLLQEDGRMSAVSIALTVHLSVPAVTERMRKLVESGHIKKLTAVAAVNHFFKQGRRVAVDHLRVATGPELVAQRGAIDGWLL